MTSSRGAANSAPRLDDHEGDRRPTTVPTAPPRPSSYSQRDTVSRRVGKLVAGILGLLILVAAAASGALLMSANTVKKLSTGYAPASDANRAALIAMLDAQTNIRGYALTGRHEDLDPYRAAAAQVLPAIDAALSTLARIDDHSVDAQLRGERRAAQVWIVEIGTVAAARRPAAARALIETTAADRRFDDFRTVNANVSQSITEIRTRFRGDSAAERRFVIPFVAVVAVVILIAAFIAVRTARGVSRPLTAVWETVRRLETGDLSARADERSGPAEVRDVAAAINSLARERSQALATQRADDELRRQVRDVTSAIRIGQDAHAMARTLVAGVGRTFDVDRVWLQTFDEGRVALISEQWRRGRQVSDIAPSSTELTELRWLANRLWHAGSVVSITDHNVPPEDTDTYLLRAPQALGAKSSAVVAVGEGGKAMGLLWLNTLYTPRVWTSAELGLLQHVAAELAQHLVQNFVLTQQRDAMRRLREADEAKTALVSTVSHELRTPLTSIIGYLDVLLDMQADDFTPEVADMLRVIERNAHRLRALIEDLLTQSQIEAGRRLVELARIDLVDVLTEVDETIEPLADNAHLGFDLELPQRGVLMIDGDPRQFGQAVTNLAANAVKFTPRGGRVVVSAAREPGAGGLDEAVVRVRDTGIGIPADELPHLFDRFFRATNARQAVIQGTGLGLAIVAEIVAQHQGTVHVDSTLGVGTTFTIRLPLAGARAAMDPSPGTVEAADDPVRES